MTEPLVTITLREYDGLLKKANTLDQQATENKVMVWTQYNTYWMPIGMATEELKNLVEGQKNAVRDMKEKMRNHARLPWYKRIFTQPPTL